MVARCGESTNDYIAWLETELEELREEVRSHRASREHGNRKSKAQLRKEYCLSKDDFLFSDNVMTFTVDAKVISEVLLEPD